MQLHKVCSSLVSTCSYPPYTSWPDKMTIDTGCIMQPVDGCGTLLGLCRLCGFLTMSRWRRLAFRGFAEQQQRYTLPESCNRCWWRWGDRENNNQPTNRPTNRPTNPPTDRPTDRPTNQPTNQHRTTRHETKRNKTKWNQRKQNKDTDKQTDKRTDERTNERTTQNTKTNTKTKQTQKNETNKTTKQASTQANKQTFPPDQTLAFPISITLELSKGTVTLAVLWLA